MKNGRQKSASGKQFILQRHVILYWIFLQAACCLLPGISHADVQSRAAVVMDASTGKLLYAKNPDLRCPPASTTKLMTAIIVIENIALHDTVTISRNAAQVSPHKAGFREGDRITVEELLYAALLGSANDAAVALAEAVSASEQRFVELMNRKAYAIGAVHTHFMNASGLPSPEQYTTASDLSKIMTYALKYQKLREIIGTRATEISTMKGNSIYLRNTNRLLWSDGDLVGGKTGYTHKARHCFVCAAERENDTVIVALLGSPSRSSLWKESESLIDRGFDVIGNREKPAIYLTKAVYEEPDDEQPVISKKTKLKKKKAKTKSKQLIAKKAANNKKAALAKKKGKTKTFAKQKNSRKKNYRIAERKKLVRNKG
jgi:D-alanyl-D-alanine carboxypeptidase (penicillin-binding protein 5/6)